MPLQSIHSRLFRISAQNDLDGGTLQVKVGQQIAQVHLDRTRKLGVLVAVEDVFQTDQKLFLVAGLCKKCTIDALG